MEHVKKIIGIDESVGDFRVKVEVQAAQVKARVFFGRKIWTVVNWGVHQWPQKHVSKSSDVDCDRHFFVRNKLVDVGADPLAPLTDRVVESILRAHRACQMKREALAA